MNNNHKTIPNSSPSQQLSLRLNRSLKVGTTLNLMVIYEDTATRQWARQIYDDVNPALRRAAYATWWKIGEFSSPGVLAGAVSTAMRADVVVVATRATESLPLPFYYWVDSWLPHRWAASGLLVALLGVPEPPVPPAGRVRSYLRALAQKSHMEFVLEERAFLTTLTSEPQLVPSDLARQ
jgi:hypothetical protein